MQYADHFKLRHYLAVQADSVPSPRGCFGAVAILE